MSETVEPDPPDMPALDDPNHRCPVCELWFVVANGLTDHIRRDHELRPR